MVTSPKEIVPDAMGRAAMRRDYRKGIMAGHAPDPLQRYRDKRSASRTPEPFGAAGPGAAAGAPALFVVQKHAARRLHWDFRLEHGGVLWSWAVPRGPSADPAEKRLAVEVEEHPIEYADFEGVIPRGEYGAGPVIVWDRGSFRFLEDPVEGMRRGKLLFALSGYKLRGEWALVRTRRGPREWLLLKHGDAFADPGGRRPFDDRSVLTGRTIDEVAAGTSRAREIGGELERLGAPRGEVDPREVAPMLALPGERPFSGEGWLFELKYDGFRALASRGGAAAALRYRSGRDATAAYPELARAVAALPCREALLDGEIVVLDQEGRPSFQALQARALAGARAALEAPATYVAFDLLAFEGFDLRRLPLARRKEMLERLVPRLGPVRYAEHVERHGEALFQEARARGLEGIVAKRADAPYRAGRSAAWVKVRSERSGDFAVVGFTAPAGSRVGLGALHLARREGAGLRYAGRVGSGLDEASLASLRERLERLRRAGPACLGAPARGGAGAWVEPRVVVEVRYLAWTRDGLLRSPVFLRVHDDKRPDECEERPAGDAAPAPERPAAPERRLALTNPDKVYWPGEGVTKGDLLAYYRAVSPWLLPYLRDRPLVLTRYPEGIGGKSFFQQDAPEWTPSWVRTARVFGEEAGRDVRHFVCDDLDSLLYVVNLGTIPLHLWASRAADPGRPDWCVIDLDPMEAPFAHVVRIARRLRALCEAVGLPSFVKTTGQSGLHVLVPLGRLCTHAQSRDLALALAGCVAAELPEIATLARSVPARGGRVYLDCLQNGQGRSSAAPFCVRPRPGAPVSTPLRWSEVRAGLDPRRFPLRTVPARMRRLGEDPLRPALDLAPDLAGALERLARRLAPGRPRGEVRTP